jgi:hypothetical protein
MPVRFRAVLLGGSSSIFPTAGNYSHICNKFPLLAVTSVALTHTIVELLYLAMIDESIFSECNTYLSSQDCRPLVPRSIAG